VRESKKEVKRDCGYPP
jgi:hypothetical protein